MVAPMKRAARPRGGGAQTRRAALSGSWLTAAAVARAAGGELVQRGRKAVGITTDSRGDCSGKLFVALRGERHDGHRYIEQAVKNGAVGVVVVHLALRQSVGAAAVRVGPLTRAF